MRPRQGDNPLASMSFSTNRWKIPTRMSKGMAKGMLFSTPRRGERCAIMRLLRMGARPPVGSESCRSS